MKLEKVKSVLSNILESKEEKSLANPVEPIETKVDVVDAETAEEDTEKINKEVNKRIKDIEKNALAVKGEDHAEEPKLVKESKEFKKEERKELGAFIHELKEKKIKHIVKRSVNEGYRYLVEYLNPVKEEKEPELPKEVTFKASEVALDTDDENPEERLSDLLSDRYGFCHFGFKYEVKKNENGEPSEFRCYDIEWDTSESLKEEKEDTVTELCPFCEEEVELKAIKYVPQKCPNCGKLIKACSLCDLDKENCTACEKKYPTEAANESLKEEAKPGDIGTQIGFSHDENPEDETEFDTSDEEEAKKLFNDFIKENGYKNVKIIYIEHRPIEESLKEEAKKPIKYEISYVDSDGHEVKGQMFTAENVSGHLKNLEDWGCTKIVVKSVDETLGESKLNEVDLETSSTKQIEIKPEKKDPSEEEEDKTEIVIKKEEEPVEEGAQGKKEPGVEFVVFDASTEGKAPILGIRSTRVEAEWLMNRLMKTGKYDNVSFDEAPKGRFHKGDDFWGPFDDNWEKMESLSEEWQYCNCKDLDEVAKLSDYCAKNNCKITAKTSTNDGYKCRIEGPFDDVHRVNDKWSMFKWKGTPLEEAIDTSKEVWEGWTVQDFIDELEPSFEQIMRGESWVKPFASKDELKKWCMSEQPYYKKYIPEVVAYFDGRVKEFGGYGKKASDGWFHEGVISGQGELSYDELAKLEEELYAELAAHNIHPEDGTFSNSTNRLADLELFLVISGDWKHDHLAAASVVEDFCKEKGYVITKHDEVEIGDSGSDWYDAEHTWFLIKDTDGKMADRVAGFKKMFARPEDESLEEDINIKINKDNIEITEPAEEGEETVAVIETPKAGEESKVAPEEEQPEEGAPEESEEEIKEPVEEELGKETIYIKYWEDEELRDQGISEIYLDKFESVEDAKEVARKLIDRDGFASVEVFISPKGEIESADDKLVWGYDGVDTWTESLEKKAKAVVTDEEFKTIDEDDVSWMTSTDMSALKEAKVDEPEVKEPTTKKVVNFEDVEEDDISWLK